MRRSRPCARGIQELRRGEDVRGRRPSLLFAQAFTTGLPSDECPTPEILLDAYHQVLPEPQRLLVIDHLAACAVCAEAWRLARQTTRGPGGSS